MKAREAIQGTKAAVRTLHLRDGTKQYVWTPGLMMVLVNSFLVHATATDADSEPHQLDWQPCPDDVWHVAYAQYTLPAARVGRLHEIVERDKVAQVRYGSGGKNQVVLWDGQQLPEEMLVDCAILFDDDWEVL
jgi:hypothetical protein